MPDRFLLKKLSWNLNYDNFFRIINKTRELKSEWTMKKKLLLLSTGGPIASVVSEAGLVTKGSGEQLINMLGELPYDITVEDILQLDSSNIQPEESKLVAEKIYENQNKYDGIVVYHCTDSFVYKSSLLSFMLINNIIIDELTVNIL